MLNPNEKCAVFLDIDGTLISGSFEIPEGNQKAIAAAREKGHMVFINTGRSWGNIPEILLSQFNVDGIIAGSGVMITMNGKTVYQASMSNELVRRIAEYAFNHREYWYIFEGYNRVYPVRDDEPDSDCQNLLDKPEDVEKMLDGDEIQVIAMGVKVPDEFKELFKDEIDVFQFETYADCVIKGINKATGIAKAWVLLWQMPSRAFLMLRIMLRNLLKTAVLPPLLKNSYYNERVQEYEKTDQNPCRDCCWCRRSCACRWRGYVSLYTEHGHSALDGVKRSFPQ